VNGVYYIVDITLELSIPRVKINSAPCLTLYTFSLLSFVSLGEQISSPYKINFYQRLTDSNFPCYEATTRRRDLETWCPSKTICSIRWLYNWSFLNQLWFLTRLWCTAEDSMTTLYFCYNDIRVSPIWFRSNYST
jgi:hypothetical protein